MPLPPDITFDPVAPAEGTKYDPDTIYDLDATLNSHAYWAILSDDGSRSLIGYKNVTVHAQIPTDFPGMDAYLIHRNRREAYSTDDEWIDYDWTLSTIPVNQYGYLPEWRSHVATFCHSFDALAGFESFRQLSATQKVTAFRVGQTIGGHAWERLAFWLTYDASLSEDWKLGIVFDPVKKAVDAVCIECQSVSAALRLALNINATDFAAKLAAGHIHGTDRTVNPWIPGDLLTVVPAPSEEVSIETAISAHVAAYNGARDYYLAHVAHEVISHEHD